MLLATSCTDPGIKSKSVFVNRKVLYIYKLYLFSNLQGVGGDSEISPAICPTGFVKFIDVCIQDVDNTPTDFNGFYI